MKLRTAIDFLGWLFLLAVVESSCSQPLQLEMVPFLPPMKRELFSRIHNIRGAVSFFISFKLCELQNAEKKSCKIFRKIVARNLSNNLKTDDIFPSLLYCKKFMSEFLIWQFQALLKCVMVFKIQERFLFVFLSRISLWVPPWLFSLFLSRTSPWNDLFTFSVMIFTASAVNFILFLSSISLYFACFSQFWVFWKHDGSF